METLRLAMAATDLANASMQYAEKMNTVYEADVRNHLLHIFPKVFYEVENLDLSKHDYDFICSLLEKLEETESHELFFRQKATLLNLADASSDLAKAAVQLEMEGCSTKEMFAARGMLVESFTKVVSLLDGMPFTKDEIVQACTVYAALPKKQDHFYELIWFHGRCDTGSIYVKVPFSKDDFWDEDTFLYELHKFGLIGFEQIDSICRIREATAEEYIDATKGRTSDTHYYELLWFHGRCDDGSFYVKTPLLKEVFFDEDAFLYALYKRKLIESAWINSIYEIREITKEEYIEATEEEE